MLEVINARKDYGSLTAVKELSFQIRPGEVFGLLGTNGAGKSKIGRASCRERV